MNIAANDAHILEPSIVITKFVSLLVLALWSGSMAFTVSDYIHYSRTQAAHAAPPNGAGSEQPLTKSWTSVLQLLSAH